MCGPALTWGLYGVGRDSAGMGTMRVLPEGARSHLSGFARRPAWPEAARAGAYAGGSACVLAVLFWAAEAGRARPRAPAGQPRMCARGVGRRTLARCCHLVAVVLLGLLSSIEALKQRCQL